MASTRSFPVSAHTMHDGYRAPRIASAAFAALLIGGVACSPDRSVEERRRSGDEALEPAWATLVEMPTPRTEVTGATVGGKIYVIGGFAEVGGTVPTVEVYSVDLDQWSSGPDLPMAVNHAMATARRGKIYLFGGYRGPGIAKPTKRAFVLKKGEWRSLPSMPYPVAAGGAVTSGGKIYITGGVRRLDRTEGHRLSGRTLVYNAKKRVWRKKPPLPTKRQHLGAAGHAGRIYVVGGRTQGLQTNLAIAEAMNRSNGRWRSLPDMPTARGGLAATATTSGLIVAVGGEESAGTFQEVEAFNATSGEWSELPPLPTPRHGLAVVAIGDRVFAIGGGPQPGLTYSGANEMLDLSPAGSSTP